MSNPDLLPNGSPYREFAPPDYLRDVVVCYWHRSGLSAPASGAIMPDGCIDIVWMGEQPPYVAGPMTVAVAPGAAAGLDVLGVRFRPGVAPAILGVGALELRDQRVPCLDLWPGELARSWGDVSSRGTLADRFTALSAVITSRMDAVCPPDEAVVRAARWLSTDPQSTLASLMQRSSLSERQMRRRFDEAIGYGPKTLQRILRLQRLLWIASQPRSGSPSLSRLAYAAGYADQPHMTREVVALTASTPGRLLLPGRAHSAVADLFKT
jgi:AraC-like DNA-binding protein